MVLPNKDVIFTDTSINNPTSYDWDFGDGTVISKTLINPVSHTFAAEGIYTVKHTAYNSCGQGSTQQNIVVSSTLPVPEPGVCPKDPLGSFMCSVLKVPPPPNYTDIVPQSPEEILQPPDLSKLLPPPAGLPPLPVLPTITIPPPTVASKAENEIYMERNL